MWMVIALSFSPIQTLVAHNVTKKINNNFGTEIHIEKIGLNWKGQLKLKDVYIADHHKDTLIHVERLHTRITAFKPLAKAQLNFGHTTVKKPHFHIKSYKNEEKSNLNVFIDKFTNDNPKDETPFILNFNRLLIEDGDFLISNEERENPISFYMADIHFNAKDFNLIDDRIKANIQDLKFKSFDTLVISSTKGLYSFGPTHMTLENAEITTPYSRLVGNLNYDYEEGGLADFVNAVNWTFDLEPSVVNTNDIRVFYDELGEDIEINIQGLVLGTLNDFLFENADVNYSNSIIKGDIAFTDIIQETPDFIIQLEAEQLQTNTRDLKQLLPNILGATLPDELDRLGKVSLSGKNILYPNKLLTKSKWNTAIGAADVDLSLENIQNFEIAKYEGNVGLSNFDIGKLIDKPNLGKVSSNLHFKGIGTKAETINTEIDGVISSFYANTYNYTNIELKGDFKQPVFNGKISIKDPNLDMDFDGLIDRSESNYKYDFKAEVNFSELNQLGFVKRDSISVFTGIVTMDMIGKDEDDVVGEINFQETFYQTHDKYYYFDDFTISSSFNEEENRSITINSPDIVTGHLTGKFKLLDLPSLIENGIGSIYTNYKPKEITENQHVSYEFEIHNKIIDVFIPELEIGDNTILKGEVASDEKTFVVDFRSPEMMAYDHYIRNINLQVDYDNPMHNMYITVDSIDTKIYAINNLEIDNVTQNDTLSISTNFRGGKGQKDFFDLSIYHTINKKGHSVFGIKKSGVFYNNNLWYLNYKNDDHNKVVIDRGEKTVQVDSLVLNHKDEYIRMAGVMRDTIHKDLQLSFDQVNLGNIIPKTDGLDIYGIINGGFNLFQEQNIYQPKSTISIDDLSVNELNYGLYSLYIDGNENLTRYDITTSLANESHEHFKGIGYIELEKGIPNINLNIDLNSFDIGGFSPLGKDIVSNLHGEISGRLQLIGDLRDPETIGRLYAHNTGLSIPYLNVDYKLKDNSEIVISKDLIHIRQTEISEDEFNTTGNLEARLVHDRFSNAHLDIDVSGENFLALNTSNHEDALYYGTAFITGNANIHGPVDELTIDIIASTEENTNFSIPLSNVESISDDSFILFISEAEKNRRLTGIDTRTRREVRGLDINFDLDINNKAEVNVVVDQQNNSSLRAKGFGKILIQINTLGKFHMEGDFQVVEGDYDFRYGGIIQKLIKVMPGGFVSWDGNPQLATVNLRAKYETNANPSVLLDDTSINRTIPVEVYIDISGELVQPDLNFDIDFPRVSSSVKSELEYKLQNREERDKQALFLIASGSFVNDNFQGANAFSGTLVDKVSGILNELFADKDGLFKVGLDYTQGSNLPNQETADRFGVSLSTQINERILINGKVGVPVGGVYESSIAGDIEVQWLVNEDGSLRLLFFNRQAEVQFLGENQIFEQGAGISYSVDFDTFKELIKKFFGKNIELEKAKNIPLPAIPDDDSFDLQEYLNKYGIRPRNLKL